MGLVGAVTVALATQALTTNSYLDSPCRALRGCSVRVPALLAGR